MYSLLRNFLSTRSAAIVLTLWYIFLLTSLILLVDHTQNGGFRYGQL